MRVAVPEQTITDALASMQAHRQRRAVLWNNAARPLPRCDESWLRRATVLFDPAPPPAVPPLVFCTPKPAPAPEPMPGPVTLTATQEILRTCRAIIEATAREMLPDEPIHEAVLALKSDRRFLYLCNARHVAMYLCTRWTLASLPTIGRILNRDHTSVISGRNRIKRRIAAGDLELAAAVAAIATQLGMTP